MCRIEAAVHADIFFCRWDTSTDGDIQMKTDTTLYEIYNELGVQNIMQTPEAEQFIDEVCNAKSNEMPDILAA